MRTIIQPQSTERNVAGVASICDSYGLQVDSTVLRSRVQVPRSFTGVKLELTPSAEFEATDQRKNLTLSALACKVLCFRRSLFQILGIALALQVFATDSPLLTAPSSFESVWLWKIDTPNRQIYIAGDWHDHFLLPNEKLSHKLAYKAYDSSSRVLTESVSVKRLVGDKLESRLTPKTWDVLSKAINQSVTIKQKKMSNLSDAQRALPTENVVDFVNRMPDIHLFETLYQILLPVPEKQPLQGRVEAGFLKEIVSKERKNNTAKQASIERSDEGYRAWSENCNQASDTEALILEILDLTGNKSSESMRSVEEFLTEFRKNTGTTENISSSYRKIPLESYTQRCAVKSRNSLWMKKIKEELRSNENIQPLMVVAGIGHVVGEFGLLSLLCKEGYCKAERVTQLN
jgi:hypothetical protein